jgi:O-antigen ligase
VIANPRMGTKTNTNTSLGSVVQPGFFATWRDRAKQALTIDVLAVLVAAFLPWSTSAVGILVVLWLIALIPTLDVGAFLQSLKRPACALPLAFVALAVVGTLWASSPWPVRLHGINPVAKLLVIPFLLYHFERSHRGVWVFVAFLVSCSLLMALSWIVLFAPELKVTSTVNSGVPVKNYIDQSQEFALCMFALPPFVLTLFDQRRIATAVVCGALIVAFFTNMMFVVSARTALVYMPVLLILFAVFYLSKRAIVLSLTVAVAAAALVWLNSPYLRQRVENVATEYQIYRETNAVTSTGERLEYWRKSLRFFAEAPLLGHGTGSTRQLFERDAVGQAGVSAEVVSNPHNQTLNVAVQWGMFGCVVLYAMWFWHLLLFRGTRLSSWIGLVVVVQNFVSSLFNSHLFDFHEGWMYVLGVGVAGGMAMQRRTGRSVVNGVVSCDPTQPSEVRPQ